MTAVNGDHPALATRTCSFNIHCNTPWTEEIAKPFSEGRTHVYSSILITTPMNSHMHTHALHYSKLSIMMYSVHECTLYMYVRIYTKILYIYLNYMYMHRSHINFSENNPSAYMLKQTNLPTWKDWMVYHVHCTYMYVYNIHAHNMHVYVHGRLLTW